MALPILIIVVVVNTLLAALVYKNNPKSITNIVFGLLSLFIILWLMATYISLAPQYISSSLFWIRLSIFLAVPQALLFFILASTIPNENLQLKTRTLIILVSWFTLIMLLSISPFTFTGIDIVNGSPNPIPGIGLIPFAFTVISFSGAAVYILLRRLKETVGIVKEQLRYVTFGIFLMIGLIIATILIPIALFNTNTFA